MAGNLTLELLCGKKPVLPKRGGHFIPYGSPAKTPILLDGLMLDNPSYANAHSRHLE